MKNQIAIALTASYAAAYGTPEYCEGYFVGLVSRGWDCSFENMKLTTCTKPGEDFASVASDGVADYETACKIVYGDFLTWRQPTSKACSQWKEDNFHIDSYVPTEADMKTYKWIHACYKAAALNLTAFGAAAMATIATLAF